MNYVHMFQYNIPAENQAFGKTDRYINVISEWDDKYINSEGKPYLVISQPINMTFYDAMQPISWHKVKDDIDKIAENHFAGIAKQERINQARAILAVEENPVLARYEENNAIQLID